MPTTNGNSRTIISAAVILGVASLVSRLVGLFRERVLTTTFGAGDTFDAFVAAFRLPDLVFNLIVVGALSAAFIPLFTEKLVTGKRQKEAFSFALSVLHTMLLLVMVASVFYAIAAPQLVPLIAPGFSGDKLEQTILLSRIMALQPILLSISFVVSGVLNSFQRFAAYAAAPILYNIGIIIGVLYLVPRLGVAGLGWGVVLGAVLHLIVQLPALWQTGFRWQPVFAWKSKDVRTLLRMAIPRIFGLSGQQVNLFIVTILGSSLAAGSISAFHLANNVQSVPIGIFGIAFAQAAFPTMAAQMAQRRRSDFRNTITRTFRYILFFVIPASVFIFLLRAQIVRVLFGAGAFDWEDTILTFETLGLLALSLFAQATIPLLARAFYVQQNTSIPVAISIISMVANVFLALYLSPILGVQGLALAFSLSAVINVFLLLMMLHYRLDGLNDREVIVGLVKVSAAALFAGLVLQVLKYPLAAIVDMTRFWGVFVQMLGAMGGGAAVYLALCWLMKCEELAVIRRYIPHKFKLKPGTETTRFEGMVE